MRHKLNKLFQNVIQNQEEGGGRNKTVFQDGQPCQIMPYIETFQFIALNKF